MNKKKESMSNGRKEKNQICNEVIDFHNLRSSNWKSDPVLSKNRKTLFMKKEKPKQRNDCNNDVINDTLNGQLVSSEDLELVPIRNRFESFEEMRERLEEYEIKLQQAYGENFLLKKQLKEKQAEMSNRSQQVSALRWKNRNLTLRLKECELKVEKLEKQINYNSPGSYSTELLNVALSKVPSNQQHQSDLSSQNLTFVPNFEERLLNQLREAEKRYAALEQEFNHEKLQWNEDKFKVVKYQKKLQKNYLRMCKRSDELERKLKIVSLSSSTCPEDNIILNCTDV